MNSKCILLAILFLLSVPEFSYAGFATNSAQATTDRKVIIAQRHSNAMTLLNKKIAQVKSAFHPGDQVQKGVAGKLSFIFGFCGFIPVIGALFSIAAITLGAIGLKKHQKHSLAGIILGAGSLTLGIILTILIFASI